MTEKQLKIVGWGYEGDEISAEEHEMISTRFTERFEGDFEIRKAPFHTPKTQKRHSAYSRLQPIATFERVLERSQKRLEADRGPIF